LSSWGSPFSHEPITLQISANAPTVFVSFGTLNLSQARMRLSRLLAPFRLRGRYELWDRVRPEKEPILESLALDVPPARSPNHPQKKNTH
jgi:hypothetical protein